MTKYRIKKHQHQWSDGSGGLDVIWLVQKKDAWYSSWKPVDFFFSFRDAYQYGFKIKYPEFHL